MQKIVTKEIDLNGRKLKLETGKLARQADAAVEAFWGDTVILATVATKPLLENMGYFPLSVEYVEKYYAGGRITAQKFIKRETRPSDKAVLSGRAIDRSIRPLFPKELQQEVQVIITVLSFDGINDPVTLGLIGASAALSISSVPWMGPLGVARMVINGQGLEANPLMKQNGLKLDLIVASTKDKVVMVEAEAQEVPDEAVFDAIKKGVEASLPVISLIEEFTKAVAKAKMQYSTIAEQLEEAILKEVKELAHQRIEQALFDSEHPWHEATGELIKIELSQKYADVLTPQIVSGVFDKVAKEIMNDTILNKGKRVDGRAMDEVRALQMETGILPRTHGSALFSRGDTQVLSIATLGPLSAGQTLEGMEGERMKRFMHHYNMSINPFSTGEVKKIVSPNRRDVGHGDLVERSLLAVLPSEEDFPYAIRVVSEVLAANASTSQASVCAASLSLLNAGVPIEPVAGVAMGLLSTPIESESKEKKFQVITDMRAVEDFYGEMDFKVAGTLKGITAIQMDTKLVGLSFEIVEEALRQGKKARESIIAEMKKVMPKQVELSKYAPKIEVTHIKPEEIGLLIGSGGKTINGIIAETGAQIDIEDDGTVMVSSADQAAIDKALAKIQAMFRKIEIGEEFDGKVVRLAPFGAFVEILPGKDGLVHISQMAPGRVEKVEDIVSEGQMVHVRVTDVDTQGKVGLSMLFGENMKPDSESRPRFDRGGSSFGGGGERRGFGGGMDRPRRNFGSGGKRDFRGGRDRGGRGGGRSGFGR